jgi:outer membrane protein OmpA-like peptidoglycan-associated protein
LISNARVDTPSLEKPPTIDQATNPRDSAAVPTTDLIKGAAADPAAQTSDNLRQTPAGSDCLPDRGPPTTEKPFTPDKPSAETIDKQVQLAEADANKVSSKQADAIREEKQQHERSDASHDKGKKPGEGVKEAADRSAARPAESARGRSSEGSHESHAEKTAQKSGRGHVGFASGDHTVSRDTLDKMLDATPGLRGAMMDPTRTVYLTGTSSRVGSDSANQTLSERRAEAVADAFRREYGATAKFQTEGSGSEHAEQSGDKRSSDNPDERQVWVSFQRSSEVGDDVKVPDVELPRVPEAEEANPLIEIGRIPVENYGFDEIAKRALEYETGSNLTPGVEAASALGAIAEVAVGTVEMLYHWAEAAHAGDMAFRQSVYINPFVESLTKLTGPDRSSAREEIQRTSHYHMGRNDIEEFELEPGDTRGQQQFIDVVASTARLDALKVVDTMGARWASDFAAQHPNAAERADFIRHALETYRKAE